jgi:ribonuclease HII
MIIGFDEAGRGPVLGPMIVGSVAVEDTAVLPETIQDSKQLTDTQREQLYSGLDNSTDIQTDFIVVSPEQIDYSDSISQLTLDSMAELGNKNATDGSMVFADACLRDESKVVDQLYKLIQLEDISVVAEHNADVSYPIVSAASVVAKHHRERIVEDLQDTFGEIGSGYPSDPTTKEFLESYMKKHSTPPPFARKSWKTITRLQEDLNLN